MVFVRVFCNLMFVAFLLKVWFSSWDFVKDWVYVSIGADAAHSVGNWCFGVSICMIFAICAQLLAWGNQHGEKWVFDRLINFSIIRVIKSVVFICWNRV